MMNGMTDALKELAQEARQSVGEAAPANKEQDAGSAGETGAGANAKAAVRYIVAVLTVVYYYQTSNITGCRRIIQSFQANKEATEEDPSVSKGSPNDKEQSAGCSGVMGIVAGANAAVRRLVAGTLTVCMFTIINHLTSQVARSIKYVQPSLEVEKTANVSNQGDILCYLNVN